MKPLDKKDQPKLFAMIGIAVLGFGYGAFTLATSSVATPKPLPSPSPAAQTAEGAQGADDGTWKPDGLQVLPTGGRDPFMPEGSAAPQPTASPTPKATPAPVVKPGGGPEIRWPSHNQVIPGPKLKPLAVGPILKPTPVPTPAPPPAPTLELSGVLVAEEDSRSKAIFKNKDRNQILGVGDAAGNGWRVSNIQERKVEIIDPTTGRRATVELK